MTPSTTPSTPGDQGGIVVDGADIVFYPSVRKGLGNFNKRAKFILLPAAFLIFLMCGFTAAFLLRERAIHAHSIPPASLQSLNFAIVMTMAVPFFVAALYGGVYVVMVRYLRRMRDPILTLTPEGIIINSQLTKIGLMYWNEIAEIRPYNLMYRFIGLVPRDLGALARRIGGKRAALMRVNALVMPIYKIFGIFVAPINIAQEHLPVTVDEAVYRINEYAASLHGRAPEATWPPAPGQGSERRN